MYLHVSEKYALLNAGHVVGPHTAGMVCSLVHDEQGFW